MALTVLDTTMLHARKHASAGWACFLNIAEPSLRETGYLLLLAHDLGTISEDQHRDVKRDVDAVFAPLHGLEKAVAKEADAPADLIALLASTLAISLRTCLTSPA